MTGDLTELDELQSGLTSGFWARLNRFALEEWGPSGERYQQAVKQAISGGLGTEVESVHRLKNITFAQAEILRLLQWPQERVAQLERLKQQHVSAQGGSRRGPGL